MNDTTQMLLNTPIGKELTNEQARALVHAGELRTAAAGSTLFAAGEPDDALYVILEGALQVTLGKPMAGATVVATLGAGQIAGELEVMTHSARVATLSVTEDATLLMIPRARLETMLASNDNAANKLMLTIARTLARRLAAVNQRIIGKPTTPTAETPETMEVSDADVIPIDDDDLDVLDKLWG